MSSRRWAGGALLGPLACALVFAGCSPRAGGASTMVGSKDLKVLPESLSADGETPLGGLVARRFRLRNGLRVITCPDPHATTVAYMTWFDVGSRDESPGHTGLAHLFEHLMFTQTKTQKDGAFDATIEAVGGNSNAHTSQDATAYIDVVPASAIDTVIGLEADRMLNLDLRAKQVTNEKNVVLEEWASVLLDDVDGRIEESLWREAFATHPYRGSVLGAKADIEAVTPADAVSFYRRFYGPARAIVVVVGNFREDEVLSRISAAYGTLPGSPDEARPALPADETLASVRRASFEAPLAAPRVAIGIPAPGFASADRVPFEILAEVLAGGRSSRLGKRLVVDTAEVAGLDSAVAPTAGAGLWSLLAQLHRGKRAETTEAAVLAELRRAAEAGFSDAEVEAAKNRWESALWQSMRSAEGKAEVLGEHESVGGDMRLFERRLVQAREVSPTSLQALAARQLASPGHVVVTVLPGAPAP